MTKKKFIKYSIIGVIIIIFCYYLYKGEINKPVEVLNQYVDGDNLKVELSDTGSCLLSDEIKEDSTWIQADENNTCTIPIENYQTNLYIRNTYDTLINEIDDNDYSHIDNISITSGDIYLALEGKEKLTYETSYKGIINDKVILKSKDSSIATVDEDGTVHGVSVGVTDIIASFGDKEDSVSVTVTDLIVVRGKEFDTSKPFLPCGVYSKEDNDLLDKILESRVEKVGYGTRAAVAETARFLCLEFPYRINYFTENGRLESYVGSFCDGEGRYYHKGLYLDPSRYETIDKDLVVGGLACWGCNTYEYTYNRRVANGLDCSGFVSWAVYNAGFDCHDLGAGIAKYWPDMTDLGEKVWLADVLKENKLRVGDLLAGGDGGPTDGGHIAIVAGIDKDGYIYVAEELGYANAWGLFIKKYDNQSLLRYFYWQVDMEEYYQGKDGNLTNFWIEEE